MVQNYPIHVNSAQRAVTTSFKALILVLIFANLAIMGSTQSVTPYYFTENLKLTKWEDISFNYGHQLIQNNLNLEYKASVAYHTQNKKY